MKFIAGFVTAIVVIAALAVAVIVSGAYNIAATVPHTGFERLILSNAMLYSVRSHADQDVTRTWNEDQLREGFREYKEMCIYCHGAPGKDASDIGKGLRPEPPDLAKTSNRWNNAVLFWIIKNGIKMTGMPAFAPTHGDNAIWNIVGFVRRLPRLSAAEYEKMEQESRELHEHHH